MMKVDLSRREVMLGAGAALAVGALPFSAAAQTQRPEESAPDPTRERRMKWWHDARFGMFIHWGLYSVLGRHEWVMENEGIPVSEYEPLAKQFKPKPNAAQRDLRGCRPSSQALRPPMAKRS